MSPGEKFLENAMNPGEFTIPIYFYSKNKREQEYRSSYYDYAIRKMTRLFDDPKDATRGKATST